MNAQSQKFLALVRHPIKFPLFLLGKLPSAFFSGVKVKYIDEHKAVASVPYKWFSQNPFKSTYFACLAMAAELSTGLLGMLHTYNSPMPVSMLVVGLEAKYYKKATGITIFTCNDGDAIKNIIEDAFNSGEGRSIKAVSTGVNSDGELVAEFFVTWSFKIKSSRPQRGGNA
ncbi:MAG: thioesterase [Ferruginibacter sp.]